LYGNTINNDFVLDDFSAIVENRFVQSGTEGIPDIFTSHYQKGYWSRPGFLCPIRDSYSLSKKNTTPSDTNKMESTMINHIFSCFLASIFVFLFTSICFGLKGD